MPVRQEALAVTLSYVCRAGGMRPNEQLSRCRAERVARSRFVAAGRQRHLHLLRQTAGAVQVSISPWESLMRENANRIYHLKGSPFEIGYVMGQSLGSKLEVNIERYV
jgi:hypothetical protein